MVDLRAHKKIGWLLAAYLLVLPVAIVLLEMHYFVDIPVGFAIAAIVIVISDSAALRSVQRLLQDCLHAGRAPIGRAQPKFGRAQLNR